MQAEFSLSIIHPRAFDKSLNVQVHWNEPREAVVNQAGLDRMGRSKKGGAENHAAIEEYGILQNEPQMNAD